MGGFPGGSVVKNPPANPGDTDSITGLGRSPEGENGNHSCILAWESPWTEDPGGLQSMGLQGVVHGSVTSVQVHRDMGRIWSQADMASSLCHLTSL